MRTFRFLPVLCLAALASASSAQLVFGSTTTSSTTSGAYYLDVSTDVAKQLWVGPGSGNASRKVNGLASDATNGLIYGNDSARLYKWNYGGVGTNPTFVSGFYRTGTNGLVYATGVDDLAFAQGNLYAYTNFNASGGSNVEDGIYRIDPNVVGGASQTNMTLVWRHNDLVYNFKGFGYDPSTSLFYAVNAPNGSSLQSPTGIYTIDLFSATQTVTRIAALDSTIPNPDGLAVGGGKVWLSGKPAGSDMYIESYDLTTGLYGDRLSIDLGDATARATGMTWAPGALSPLPTPEPAPFLALGVGALAVLRRRRPTRSA